MTKEEAINHIRYGIIEGNYHLPKELGIEACEMAIKALEQEPCEDCISRDEAIRVAEQGQIQGYEWQFKKLCNLPSVTPQPKTGHWIDFDFEEDKYDKIKCSECGRSFIVDSYHWCDIGFTKDDLEYCPDCGAKMEVNADDSN